MSDDHIMKREKMVWIERNFVHSDSLFLTHGCCIFCCASPMRKSRLWTLWDPLRVRVPQDEVEADYMQHSQVPHILHPLPVMVARLPSALHLSFILFKEGFKGFPFVCPPACDRVRSLAAIDPNMHCGRNNTCLVLLLSYRNILDYALRVSPSRTLCISYLTWTESWFLIIIIIINGFLQATKRHGWPNIFRRDIFFYIIHVHFQDLAHFNIYIVWIRKTN